MIRNIVFDMGQVLIHWTAPQMTALLKLPEADALLVERELFRNVQGKGVVTSTRDGVIHFS